MSSIQQKRISMTSTFFFYFPLQAATWHCSRCCIVVCDDCIQPPADPDAAPTCLLCNQELSTLQQVAPVVPFWLQYTQFMRLPLSLLGIFLLVLLFAVPIFTPSTANIPIMFCMYVIAGFYGWHLLQQAATGILKDLSIDNLRQQSTKLAIQFAAFLAAIFVALDVLAVKMPTLAHSLNIALVLVLPAILMTVAIEKQISSVMQFSQLTLIISKLRFLYVPVVLASLLLLTITSAITTLLADVLSAQVMQGLEQALYSYGLWVMMSVVGYVLFEFHQLLDFEVLGKKNKKRILSKQQDIQQARLEVFLKEGAYDKAAALLKTQSEKFKNNPDIQEKYYQLLIFMQDAEQVPFQASHYMEALLAVGQDAQALDVLRKVRRLVPNFMPPTAEMRYTLAKVSAEHQHYELACDLLRQLHKEYPHYAELPEAYLLLAKLLHEKFNNSREALETMEYLALRFQKHPRYALIDKFWRALGGKPKEDFVL